MCALPISFNHLGRKARSMASSRGLAVAAESVRRSEGLSSLNGSMCKVMVYLANALSASLMPSLTPTSAGNFFQANDASLSL